MSQPPSNSDPSSRPLLGWPAALVLFFLILIVALLLVFYRLETWPMRTAAQSTEQLERVGRDLRAAFIDITHLQPRVTVNDRVLFEQTVPTAELATVSRRLEVEHEFLHTWAGSTKSLKLRAVFVVKAGFDLRQNFSAHVSENNIDVRLPAAKILNVEQEQVEVLALENGFWNRISVADLENELRVLPQLARNKAAAAGLTNEAERVLKEQLEKKIQAQIPLRVTFGGLKPKG